MLYAKIKHDRQYYNSKNKGLKLIKDELYTISEFNRLKDKFALDRDDYELVNIPKSQTGFFFGARLQLKGGE